jgi:DNA polymerase-1
MKKLLIVDGNSILNRGYYGLPKMQNKDGCFTNGVLGFMNILFRVISENDPEFLIVTFDLPKPTFRHLMYSEYKGTRKEAEPEFVMQIPVIHELLRSMGVTVLEKEGYEADDIMGTLAKRFAKEGMDVTILSGDRDLLQIADDNITIAIPKTKDKVNTIYRYKPEDVLREFLVTPAEFIDLKALMGDSSDNIPGVPGVGEKTAQKLMVEYKSLEGIYENLDSITQKSLHEKLESNKDKAFLSRTLATIEINAPIEVNIEDCRMDNLLNEESLEVLRKYELKSVIGKLEAMSGAKFEDKALEDIKYEKIDDFNKATELLNKALKLKAFGIFEDGDKGLALSFSKEENYYIEYYGFLNKEYVKGILVSLSEAYKTEVISLDIKNSYDILPVYREGFHDVMVLSYLIDPLKGEYDAIYVGERYLGSFCDTSVINDNAEAYPVLAARNALLSKDILINKVTELGMAKLYFEIEMPLTYTLFSMEKEGVLVDREALKDYSSKLSKDIEVLEKDIYEETGCEFNINSPKQLGEILFEKMGLPGGKKTKSGYSTAADVLEKLAVDNKAVADILEYRALTKLKSTYAEGLQNFIESDGRIHTHFNQTITATGRISSTDPNLQNIPIRTERGRELRKVFLPKEGYVFIDADYSQIELRLMAHMSGDDNLIEAYNSNKDIHRATASKVFKKPLEEVTDLDRRNAKAVNFGIIYGISGYGLSQGLSISRKEAEKYIDDYFETYPAVKAYVDSLISYAKDNGKSITLFNRVRPIPEINDSNFMRRKFGERVAMNAPIQGTAADIMKIAMINIEKRLREEKLQSKLIIQVHDEVLVETLESEVSRVSDIIKDEMTNAYKLRVPLEVDMHTGTNWYEAK